MVGAWIIGAEAAGRGGEHPVDGGGVLSRYFTGDIADAVGALHDGDAAFGQGAAVPLFERERLQPHHQPQQPDGELFRGSGVRGLNHLVVDGGQGGGFGDPACDPVDDPDLLGIHIAAPEGFPHGGQAVGEPPGAGQQAAHLVGLITQAATTTRRTQTHPAWAGSAPAHRMRVRQHFSSAIRRSA